MEDLDLDEAKEDLDLEGLAVQLSEEDLECSLQCSVVQHACLKTNSVHCPPGQLNKTLQ